METKEQCKTCEIINADCNACKSFEKKHKIEKLNEKITGYEFILETLKEQNQKGKWYKKVKKEIEQAEQQLKELEEGNGNKRAED